MTQKLNPKWMPVPEWIVARYMHHLRKTYRGHKAEISPREFTRSAQKFSMVFGVDSGKLLESLIKKNLFEPSAGDTFIIRYDKIM